MKEIGNIAGLIIGLAIIATIVAKPAFIAPTFTGFSNVIKAAKG